MIILWPLALLIRCGCRSIGDGRVGQWLQRDYNLHRRSRGRPRHRMQYNIAELVDPLVHVVAKIRKDALISLK